MGKYRILGALVAAFILGGKAEAQEVTEPICPQVIPCDETGTPLFPLEGPCFSRYVDFCAKLKVQYQCKQAMRPIYEENSALYQQVQKLQSKVKKLKRNARKAR